MNMPMTPLRPHLVRAMMAWIDHNDMTPHVLVDANSPGTQVPPHAINNGQVVLNLSSTATQHLEVDDYQVSFQARFGGQVMLVVLPMDSLIAIYAKESGAGMNLPPEIPGTRAAEPTDGDAPTPSRTKKTRPNHLRVVK